MFIKEIIGQRNSNRAKEVARDLSFTFRKKLKQPKLSEIGKYYRTDKTDKNHSFMNLSYLDIYEKYFEKHRSDNINILEIGIKDGASLRTWRSYFVNANIYGIDIDAQCKKLEGKRVRVEIGSQDDLEFLKSCFGGELKFDIIIDDGSHINSFTIASFEYLFDNRLNSGGFYIIEDLICSYDKLQTNHNILKTWPGMKYNDPSKVYDNERKDMDDFFLEKIEKLDHFKGNILYIHFWSMVCLVKKV